MMKMTLLDVIPRPSLLLGFPLPVLLRRSVEPEVHEMVMAGAKQVLESPLHYLR
jgi:hypothetical protein